MKKILLTILMCIAASFAAPAQDYSDLLVEMPVVPKNITLLDQRCNYIISRYWDKFNPKSSFSSLDRLDKTFGQFICLTPYATADTVHMAVDHLIDVVQKAKPENLLTLAQLAEKWVYADTAEYLSEELYFSFVEAVVKNKKAKGPSRARFQAQYDQLLNSRQGCKVEQFNYIKPDGTTGSLSDITAQFVLIMFYDPDCLDCSMAKTRLSADYSVQKLIENNQLAVLAIYPDEPTDEWREDAAKMPENWIVGAYPDADRVYTMRRQPEIYFLNSNRVISVKDVPVDNIINAFKQFVN